MPISQLRNTIEAVELLDPLAKLMRALPRDLLRLLLSSKVFHYQYERCGVTEEVSNKGAGDLCRKLATVRP